MINTTAVLSELLANPDLPILAKRARAVKAGVADKVASRASAVADKAKSAADDLRQAVDAANTISLQKIAAVRHMLRVGSKLIG